MMTTSYVFTAFLLLLPMRLPVVSARSMNEAKIHVTGSVFADLTPYGFQQCARECENSGYCQGFEFERVHLRCLLIWNGTGFSTPFSSPVYGKYATEKLPPDESCPANSKLIMAHNGEAICVKGCGFPPTINGAMIVEDGGDYTRAGTVVNYDCNKGNLRFIGGPITCLTSGHWANSDTLRGCSVLSNGICTGNDDCVSVASSVCQDGLCACPIYATYLENKTACVTDCRSLYDAGQVDIGAFNVTPNGVNRMEVRCKNGWTTIHRRRHSGVAFQRQTWESYKNGFGVRYDDYWIGLENLHMLTQTDNEILFVLELDNNKIYTLQHRKFRVYNESTNYKMTVSKDFTCSRNMTQSFLGLYESNNAAFSTIDKDNEGSSWNCVWHNGPWWYNTNCWYNIQEMNGHFERMAISLPDNNNDIQLFSVRKAEILVRRIEE